MNACTVLLLGALVVAAPASAGDPQAWGPAIARHEFKNLQGDVLRLGDDPGQVTVLNFWASWCKPCKRELVELDHMRQELGGSVRFLAVSVDRDAAKAERFVTSAGLSMPVAYDGPDGLARALDIPALPFTLVIDDRQGIVRIEGRGDAAMVELRAAVASMLRARHAATFEEVSG
jgi:thiol-disulfide isomerase/thioredoxin